MENDLRPVTISGIFYLLLMVVTLLFWVNIDTCHLQGGNMDVNIHRGPRVAWNSKVWR